MGIFSLGADITNEFTEICSQSILPKWILSMWETVEKPNLSGGVSFIWGWSFCGGYFEKNR
jgi:hypothetical protein